MEEKIEVSNTQVADLETLVENLKTIVGSFEKTKTDVHCIAQMLINLQTLVIKDNKEIQKLNGIIKQLEIKLQQGGMYQ